METVSYLSIIRRRLWILLLVPLLAVGAVVAWELRQPPQYSATATIAAPAVVGGPATNQYSGANAPRAFVADFSGAVTSPMILNHVAEKTGAATATIKDGLKVSQIGTSSLLQLTYTGPRRDQVVPVVNESAAATIRFLFQTQVTLAEKTVGEARKAVDRANAALATFYKQTGQVLPDEAYRIAAQQVADLQKDQASARAGGETTKADSLQSSIDAKKAEVAKLAPQVATYQSLVERRTQALSRLNVLEQGMEQAQAQYSAADPQAIVVVGQVQRASRLSTLVRKAAPAAGAGLFLAVGVVLLLELFSRRSHDEEPQHDAPMPSSAGNYARSQT
jgi:capsular polysaccharide biosynthesis protein